MSKNFKIALGVLLVTITMIAPLASCIYFGEEPYPHPLVVPYPDDRAHWPSDAEYIAWAIKAYSYFSSHGGSGRGAVRNRIGVPETVVALKGEVLIRETDLSIPGRGLDLVIERMWALPAIWQNNQPYGFEASTTDLGKGWFLNFPWIGKLLHTWDGRCYEIGSGNIFENHEEEHFTLVKESDSTYHLYYADGSILHFDSLGRLEKIEDNNGNCITFAYGAWPVIESSRYYGTPPDPAYPIQNDWYLANITDTVGRVVHLLYSSNRMLMGLSYCGMTVGYLYNQGLLVSVKNVQGGFTDYGYYCAYGAWLPYKVKSYEGGFTTYKYVKYASNCSDNAFYKFKISEESVYDCDSHVVSQTAYWYEGNYSRTNSSSQVLKDEYGNAKTKGICTFDSEGRVLNSTLLDMTKAQSSLCSESLSATVDGVKFDGGGYWNGTEFVAHYVFGHNWELDIYGPAGSHSFWEDGDVEVGNFTHGPGTAGYRYYTTSVSPDRGTITVTTFWTNWVIPEIEKIVYTYNSNNEVIREDKYIGDTGTVSYSTYSRYDEWGNLVYSKDAMGHETFLSYANTKTSGVFVDYDNHAKPLFSNLFYANSIPNNMHSALIGSAKLQDNATAIETYTQYDSRGNPIESRSIFGQTAVFKQFSGTFDELGSTSFSINLAGVSMQGNAALEISGESKTNQIPKIESYSRTGNGFDFTGYWENHAHNCTKYFMAHYVFGRAPDIEEGYAEVGPFKHYPGTAGYTSYSVSGTRTKVNVTTNYNVPIDCYPVKVDYHFNSQPWETITNNLYSRVNVYSIPASELVAGVNILYFRESSGNLTKFSWKLYVPIYTPPKEDIRTQSTYDCYGNVVSITDAEGMVTVYEYGSEYGHAYCTKVINSIDGFNITTSITYYFYRGLVASTTNPEGYTTYFEYDNLGRTIGTVNPDGTQLVTVYDDENRTVTSYNELGNFGKTYYDGLGRTIKTEAYLTANEVYAVQTFEYNYLGKLTAKTVPHQPGTTNPPTYRYEYDVQGRTVKTIYPDGAILQMEYDEVNNIVTAIDSNGHKKQSKADWDGNLLWVKEYYSNSSYYLTQYEYDYLGHLVKRIDANGQATVYEYGSFFGVTKTTYPDGAFTLYSLDNVGQIIWTIGRNGDNTTYTYDDLHRLTKITFADSTNRTFAYDICSRLVSTSDRDYSSTYHYDCRGRVIWESHSIRGGGPNPYYVFYDYDATGKVTKMTYPDGLDVCYEYDNLNRLVRVYSGNYTFGIFSYNVDGSPDTITYGNGVQTKYSYDIRSRLEQILTTNLNQGNMTLLSLNYTYDSVGNVIQMVNGMRTSSGEWIKSTENYSYDWLDRLVSASGGFGELQYSYDAIGNRLTQTDNGMTTTYQYDACNRLLSYQNNLTNATFTYENNGNLHSKTVNGETWQYVYDSQGMLHQVVKGQILGSYKYDSNGRRVYQMEGTKTTTTIYSGTSPIYEHVAQCAVHTLYDYVYGVGGRLARVSDGQVLYYHNDHLGSTRILTDGSGTVLAAMNYKPFGEKYQSLGNGGNFGFSGHEEDSETGLYYYGARYYDPETGRFIQEDNYGGALNNPQSQNRYAYCVNNPLKYVDPTGHKCSSTNWRDMLPEGDYEELVEEVEETTEKGILEIVQEFLEGKIDELRFEIKIAALVNKGLKVILGSMYDVDINPGEMYRPRGIPAKSARFDKATEFMDTVGKVLIAVSAGLGGAGRAMDAYPEGSWTGLETAVLAAGMDAAIKGALAFMGPVGAIILLANALAGDPIGEACFTIAQRTCDPNIQIHSYWWWRAGSEIPT